MEENKSLSELLQRMDRITWLLRGKLGLSPVSGTVLLLLLLNLPIVIASAFFHILWSRAGRVGLFEDFGWWALQVGTFPATIYAFLWLPDAIQDVVRGLYDNQVIRVNDPKRWNSFVTTLYQKYGESKWFWMSLAGVVLFDIVIWVPSQRQFITWQSVSAFSFWYTIFVWSVTFEIGLLLIIRAIFTLMWIGDMFHAFDISVKVLHPDGAGGLSPLGQFSARVGYILAIYGVGNVIGNLSQARLTHVPYYAVMRDPGVVTFWLLYLALAPLTFFLPLNAAHDAMVRARNEFIAFISKQFNKEMEQVWQAMREENLEKVQKGLGTMEQLERLYKVTARFPIWPFNAANLTRFFTAVVFPIGLNLLSIFLDKLFA